jgi:HD-like signal output (HDOD) protein
VISTIILIAVVAGLVVLVFRLWGTAQSASRSSAPAIRHKAAALPQPAGSDKPSQGDEQGDEPPHDTEATEGVFDECFKLAFGVQHFDYQISGQHAAVLAKVNENAAASVHQREYFPRRPLLLPRLMQVLNDDESTRKELVRLILEDPALTGSVLQRANSAAYRYTPEPVDSLERAVVMLGSDGLRSLMATAILQPVFRQPKGYFDNFAAITWEHARRTAAAAEACARAIDNADPFVAQLLGLLGPLGRIVLFRLTMEIYREHAGILPRAEVFIRGMQMQGANVAGFIAATWELSDPSIAAMKEQADKVSPAAMSPLGRSIYFGELCGALALLVQRGNYSVEDAQAMLMEQGLARETTFETWHAAVAANE